ncbi:hypothetical protein GDO86_013132 [Hymenochirus boettgeri]|uniref:Uncharacterized protein n=1 Tax=Hymenochirus boettgeri TaxID=247094 RepID=A0A8T2IY34_9PIPI|nr:hypothetical protein GDO86_013132 [Hymenochirus boettgeri]
MLMFCCSSFLDSNFLFFFPKATHFYINCRFSNKGNVYENCVCSLSLEECELLQLTFQRVAMAQTSLFVVFVFLFFLNKNMNIVLFVSIYILFWGGLSFTL